MSENTAPTDIVVIEKSLPILQSLPAQLAKHQASISGAVSAAEKLIDKCKGAGKMTPELDEECKNLIIKINKTDEKLKGDRSAGTQIMAMLAKAFTSEEAKLVNPVQLLQGFRNQRAREVVEENRRLEQVAKEKAAHDKEAGECRAYYVKMIAGCLNKKLHDRKVELTNNFNALTLDDIEVRGEKLRTLTNLFPMYKLSEILVYTAFPGARLKAEEIAAIDQEVKDQFDIDGFAVAYVEELDEVKRSLVERLPSKLAELQEQKAAAERAERLRQQQEEQKRKQDELDRQQRESKNKADQERIQRQQEENRVRQENLRKEQEEAERVRVQQLEEQQAREREEAGRLKDEQTARNLQAEKEAELVQASALGGTLFDVANSTNQMQVEGETRKGWEITVTHMGGWAELFQFWYMAKAASTPLDKFEALKLSQIKAYAESVADKEKINSKFLTYKETITAVNRKEKPKKATI